MSDSSRSVVITGNWKMYKTIEESIAFIKDLVPLVKNSDALICLAVPFTAIEPMAKEAKKTKVVIGAQNMNDASEGAFTGEIAARMLKDAGAKFVILGHSERRHYFHEKNDFINRKVKRALLEKLQVTLCVGETAAERDEKKTEEVLTKQILECLADVTAEQFSQVNLAYEPVWAIGTNYAATPEDAQKVHLFCRQLIEKTWGEAVAKKIVIQYGGSVKPSNAKSIMDQPDIDGVLVGGASLSPIDFSKIIDYQNA